MTMSFNSTNRRSFSTTNSKLNSSISKISSPEEISLRKKVNQIALLNLAQHDINICACQQCIYRKNLARKSPIRLQMSKGSSYRHQYQNNTKSIIDSARFSINYEQIQRQKNNKSHVIQKSNYQNNYNNNHYDKPQKKRPTDELKFAGPVSNYSSYLEQYPSFKNNSSPYVKPVQVRVQNHIKSNIKSTYQSQYKTISHAPEESGKIPDHLKSGLPWTGGSTYKQVYTLPKQLSEPRQTSSRQSSTLSTIQGKYKHQYQSSYRNQYLSGYGEKRKCAHLQDSNDINPLIAALKS